MTVRYTICSYYPDLTRTNRVFDFAVVAASSDALAVAGVNLTAFGVTDSNPFARRTAEHTFDLLVQRTDAALKLSAGTACFDAIDRLVEDNRSNFQYRPIEVLEAEEEPRTVAFRVLRDVCLRKSVPMASLRDANMDDSRTAQPRSVVHYAARSRTGHAPLKLRLDAEDVAHLAAQPAYVLHSLRECARASVTAPTCVFWDLKRGEKCPANLRGGWAICGAPRHLAANSGRLGLAPDGMMFAVYADEDGYVFDWDWVEESSVETGTPVHCVSRFDHPVRLATGATLELPEQLPVPEFDDTKACYSRRGDCIFCYISDDVSFASRINSDLTVFRAIDDRDKITGFKVKNVRRILEEDKDIVLDDGENLLVSVESALLATLKGHKGEGVHVYAMLIAAFRKAKAPPPKIRVPKKRLARREPALV